ncbi:lipoyl synthase [Anaerovorax odorimutans]|uniref:Lipoyl synthase n=1 Tax=Anaerovorax odorimutans TaxID=109327 RepID=A0ABT1RSU0_9FIRM|nr:lipoyl synthase [Anaerovorax odorimutans]MCQ4638271.1 lipoyl synthase [Anaerovorax odorimutans]
MEKIKVAYNQKSVDQMAAIMAQLNLNTVCREANCPNMGECYKKKTATFMIMGSQCTRNCRFCNVINGRPQNLDPNEPENLAQAVEKLNLSHVVVTSVTRDDLPDGGAAHFAKVIEAIKRRNPDVTVEVLIPDMKGDPASLDMVIAAKPEVINHNIETVADLYEQVRPEADYRRSLDVLAYVKRTAPDILTKTGIMVGLGETYQQVLQVMDDARDCGCDIFTVGQYLQPSEAHVSLKEYISQETFDAYEKAGYEKGFRYVASGPLVRSSYRAQEALVNEKESALHRK